ncbi:hypothetical protein VP1G_11352 [Cytospora mali]|uniref:Uncharacterized protein n=1 Tax=Cytospora mali TaxID=578113 RepID=A0A194VE38_CYTMA|nr:hypothetical protein VP1G_11352 [Valsa mali var. pyri (nom. inval.)]
MPDYSTLTANRIIEDYCEEALVERMMDLLTDIGRDAVTWVGHKWGPGTRWMTMSPDQGTIKLHEEEFDKTIAWSYQDYARLYKATVQRTTPPPNRIPSASTTRKTG